VTTHADAPDFGKMANPCPDCGHMTLHQSVVVEYGREVLVRTCSYRDCRSAWIDGRRGSA
jgi:hypothetical protein